MSLLHTFEEPQTRADLNVHGNFRNGQDVRNVGNVGNVKNFMNVKTNIKCHTFSEPKPRADLNDDGNSWEFQEWSGCWECWECLECGIVARSILIYIVFISSIIISLNLLELS